MPYFRKKLSIILIVLSNFIIVACTPIETIEETPAQKSQTDLSIDKYFPENLAITSPFEFHSKTLNRSLREYSNKTVSKYAWTTARIERLLKSTEPSICRFDPELFLKQSRDASCYGPEINYEGHPDASSVFEEKGLLPSGDLGIWQEINQPDKQACSAAQLTAKMEGIRDRSLASLMGLSSMICAINNNNHTLPDSSTLSITNEMNALNITDTVFNSVTLTHSIDLSGNDTYSYSMDFDYAPSGTHHSIIVDMEHSTKNSTGDYSGFITTQVNDEFSGGNCSDSNITRNNSLHYERDLDNQIRVQAREAQFCGHDINGLNSDNKVNPSDKFTGYNNGWGNNFAIFSANFNPLTLSGNYAYSWQAGPDDSNSRVFNIITDFSNRTGDAFYGYGNDIASSDGRITGFICNWAGPGNSHVLNDYVQHQALIITPETGQISASHSHISYAPTNSCNYDGLGHFSYDSNMDGSLDTGTKTPITAKLLEVVDNNDDRLFDEISATGFLLPLL